MQKVVAQQLDVGVVLALEPGRVTRAQHRHGDQFDGSELRSVDRSGEIVLARYQVKVWLSRHVKPP
ncbi:hypothetical protein GCM10027589_33950 [Actinocorallia lasiicapitis]